MGPALRGPGPVGDGVATDASLARTLLIGGTDVTQVCGDALVEMGMPPTGVVYLEQQVKISYAPGGFHSVRHADMAGWAAWHGIPGFAYKSNQTLASAAQDLGCDLLLAAGWYHMVPAAIRRLFQRGILGVHASLLPQLRGGAPLNWAILQGLSKTGVSLFEMADGVDEGGVYAQQGFPVGERAMIGDLVKAANMAIRALLIENWKAVADGSLVPRPQSGTPSYGRQRTDADGAIDWTRSTDEIDRLVRAVSRPYPGAWTFWRGEQVRFWRAQPSVMPTERQYSPGVLHTAQGSNPAVATGDGALVIEDSTSADGADLMPMLREAARTDAHQFASNAGTP